MKSIDQFERSRQEILKMSGRTQDAETYGQEEEKKYAWEIELEAHRERKKLEKFLKFGAVCGVVALVLALAVTYKLFISGYLF